MQKVILRVEKVIERIGEGVSWLTSILVWVICLDVLLRYFFNISYAGLFEFEWHLFALIFLLGAAFTLGKDKHVRVDVFYSKFSPRRKAWINLVGTLVFLIPFCLVIIKSSVPFVLNSFEILEGSPDPGGLPFRFLIKSAIPIGFSLLLLQALVILYKSVMVLMEGSN